MSREAFLLLCAPLLFLTTALGPDVARGQPDVGTGEGYVNTYARPGEATQTVYVWGAVGTPGIWEIEPGTGLVELFSVVRPTGYGQESPGRRTRVRLRIHRTTNGETRIAHEMRLSELLEMPPQERPTLQPQDVIEVRSVQTRKFSFQLVSTVVGTLSSVALLVIRIFDF
jgi:protein involved in polysaccharide export with SLBB domain